MRWPRLPYLGALQHVVSTMNSVYARVQSIEDWTRKQPTVREPDPFVCVLVEAENADGEPTTCGMTGRATKGGTLIEVVPHVPLKNARVTVFADLERVAFFGMFLGTDYVHAALGECPVARFAREWPMGLKLRVQCQQRALFQ